MTRAVGVVALGLWLQSCATGHVMAANDLLSSSQSSDSNASSQGSSAPSSESSNNSVESSANSNASTKSSANSSNSNQSSNNSTAQSSGGTIAVLLSTVVIGSTAATVGFVIWGLQQPHVGTKEAAKVAYDFLRVNQLQLQEDLAIGSGPTINDLASVAEIRQEHLAAFGRALREHRRELLALAVDHLSPERALTFLEQVGVIVRAQTELAADYAAFVQRHPDAG